MKYLFLGFIGVAQATPLLRRKLQTLTWDADGVEQQAPCDTPGAVHAAMCGRALSSSGDTCDTSGFTVDSIHAMNSGSCGNTARLYRVAAGDSSDKRKIFRCGPDWDSGDGNGGPICAKDGHTKDNVDVAKCTTAYAAKNENGDLTGDDNWDVNLLCTKNAAAFLTAGDSAPTNCHDIGDGPTCDGQADCSWDPDAGTVGECHSSASSDSGPTCTYEFDVSGLNNEINYNDYFHVGVDFSLSGDGTIFGISGYLPTEFGISLGDLCCDSVYVTPTQDDLVTVYNQLPNLNQILEAFTNLGVCVDTCTTDEIVNVLVNNNNGIGSMGICKVKVSSDSGPSCPKTVVADFQAGNNVDYTISIDGATAQADPQITLCEGDTLNVTRSTGFTDHPLRISDTDGNPVLNSNTGPVTGLSPGDYPYECTVSGHESMAGIVRVISTSDPECSCDSSSSDDSSPSHACDAVSCPADFTKRSSLPTGDNPSAKQCCRPMRKGCKTSGKWTYDVSADEHDDSLCVNAQTATEKDNEVSAASGYDAKRNVHKKHAREAFYKERLTKSKKAAIRAARATISDLDLPQRVKDRKKGTVKVAVAINDADDDSCEVGAQDENCASLDLADEAADETTILMTEGDGKWAVVVDGSNVIVKQKRNGAKFDMQCWAGSSWGTAEEKDPSTDASIVTHKCGSHVFMVGSLQQVCVDCTDGCDEAAGLCYVPGCTDDNACNENPDATIDDGTCTYAATGEDCDGNCLTDADADSVCDEVDDCLDGNEITACDSFTFKDVEYTENTTIAADGCGDGFQITIYPSETEERTVCGSGVLSWYTGDHTYDTADLSTLITDLPAAQNSYGCDITLTLAAGTDIDGNGVCDSEEVTEDADDTLPCNGDLSATQYIENQCCNTSPAKCD